MDISAIQPAERFIEIVHPKDKATLLGIRVSIISISDPRMKGIKRRIQDAKLKLDAKGKNFKAVEVEENLNTTIFGAMTGWQWYNPTGKEGDKDFDASRDATFKGKKPDFNRANVIAVLTELEWFADQLSDEIAEESAFFQE